MHRALKDKCSNLCASMIVSLMPQDPLCINFKQIPADFQPGSGQIELCNEQNTKLYHINRKNDLEVVFPKLFIIKKFNIKINAFQFC